MEFTLFDFLRIGGIFLVVSIGVVLKYTTAYYRTRRLRRCLLPDLIEKQKALEIIENHVNSIDYLEKILQRYAKINFEDIIIKFPIFTTVLFEELNKYLLMQNRTLTVDDLKTIVLIIKNESDEFIFYDIMKCFFISLILETNFDYKKYSEPLFELYGFLDEKKYDKKERVHGIVLLKGMVEGEYINIKKLLNRK